MMLLVSCYSTRAVMDATGLTEAQVLRQRDAVRAVDGDISVPEFEELVGVQGYSNKSLRITRADNGQYESRARVSRQELLRFCACLLLENRDALARYMLFAGKPVPRVAAATGRTTDWLEGEARLLRAAGCGARSKGPYSTTHVRLLTGFSERSARLYMENGLGTKLGARYAVSRADLLAFAQSPHEWRPKALRTLSYLSVEQAARKAGVSRRTVTDICRAGEIEAVRSGGQYLVPKSALAAIREIVEGRRRKTA